MVGLLCRRLVLSWPCFLGRGAGLWQAIIRLGQGRHIWCGFAGFGGSCLGIRLLFRRWGRSGLWRSVATACIGRMRTNHPCGRDWLRENHFHRGGLAGLRGPGLPMMGGLIQKSR
ncbi:hypothetical protein AA18895_1959 [Acetobacter ghanensis DSM 18895]|nr:hypothetical protein AA18895_1959 [Acetobacter ghanensis DSM 18895]